MVDLLISGVCYRVEEFKIIVRCLFISLVFCLVWVCLVLEKRVENVVLEIF